VSVTLALAVSFVSFLLLLGALVVGACRASSEADRVRAAALARVRAQEQQRHRAYPPE
jgi:hypothetical protein